MERLGDVVDRLIADMAIGLDDAEFAHLVGDLYRAGPAAVAALLDAVGSRYLIRTEIETLLRRAQP